VGTAPRPGAVAIKRGCGVLVGAARTVIVDDGSGGAGFEWAPVVLAAVAGLVGLLQRLHLSSGKQGALIASAEDSECIVFRSLHSNVSSPSKIWLFQQHLVYIS